MVVSFIFCLSPFGFIILACSLRKVQHSATGQPALTMACSSFMRSKSVAICIREAELFSSLLRYARAIRDNQPQPHLLRLTRATRFRLLLDLPVDHTNPQQPSLQREDQKQR